MKQILRSLALALYSFLLAGCATLPEGTPFNDPENRFHQERISSIDVLHYRIQARIDLKGRSLAGSTMIRFQPLRPLRELELDAARDLTILEVRRGEEILETRHEGGKLRIRFPDSISAETSLSIDYTAKPTRGLYFVLPDEGYPDKPVMAWTQGET